MALVKGKGRQSSAVAVEAEGADVFLRALRDGSMVLADWRQSAIMRGRGFTTNVGSFTAPVTGGGSGGTIIDSDQPSFVVSVPNGVCILPIRVQIAVLPGAFAAEGNETDIVLGIDQDKAQDASGTSSPGTAYNMNTLCGEYSACTVTTEFTADATAPVMDIELAHAVIHTDDASTTVGTYLAKLEFLYEPETPPIINGPAMLLGYWGGAVGATGFASISWLEFPETTFKL